MTEGKYSSPAIAKELRKRYGKGKTSVVKINMRHELEVNNFLAKIEEAHKKAAKSKLPAYK